MAGSCLVFSTLESCGILNRIPKVVFVHDQQWLSAATALNGNFYFRP
ncbi:MAG TPA: hypothetical protein VGK58_04425 [Lacipirellulaceae bacterium]